VIYFASQNAICSQSERDIFCIAKSDIEQSPALFSYADFVRIKVRIKDKSSIAFANTALPLYKIIPLTVYP